MNIGLIIGKKNSVGVPNKNIKKILGRKSCEYAFIAAKYAKLDKIYVSTDSKIISNVGKKYGAILINRQKKLATPNSLTEDVLLNAYYKIKNDCKKNNIKTISLIFCNNPAIDVNLLKKAIKIVNKNKFFDSCFSVAKYDMFAPARARKISKTGIIMPFDNASINKKTSSIRNSQGSVYFCDLSIQVMKPTCFENMNKGKLPFKWQGRKSKAILTDFGFDIDSEWQYAVIEYWLKKRGFTEKKIPWKK
tara:strand:- start:62 stop:805 length:744 start_codon:yes stop_codon:yes gene_type:complete